MPKKLLFPDAVRTLLSTRFDRQHQTWLAGQGTWPLSVPLGVPSEKDLAEDSASVRDWVSAWERERGPGELVWASRQFGRLGAHRFPAEVRLERAAAVASLVGQGERWDAASRRYRLLVARYPEFSQGTALQSRFNVLADYSEDDFTRLTSLLAWLTANPASGLYLRQLPVEGLDTKWIQPRSGLVTGLLRALLPERLSSDFHEMCGLLRPPHRVRIRVLCSRLRSVVGGLADIEAPAAEISQLPLSPSGVVIVENLETGLALPDMDGVVAILKLGNAVSALANVSWLEGSKAVYWGDIDTHGFAILSRARMAVPAMQSILMDEATLLASRSLWVEEPVQCADGAFENLQPSERAVYEGLRSQRWGINIRLEQERLAWGSAVEKVSAALAPSGHCESADEVAT